MVWYDQMCIRKKVGGDFSVVITTFDRVKVTNMEVENHSGKLKPFQF